VSGIAKVDPRRSALQRGGWHGRAGGDFGWCDARLELVKDRADRQVALEVLECLLDRHQQQIMAPQPSSSRNSPACAIALVAVERRHRFRPDRVWLTDRGVNHAIPWTVLPKGACVSSSSIGENDGHHCF
jgi:hypothetical protein